MRAVVVREGESAPTVVDLPRPDPGPGEALVRTLRVGVDGTDHEVLRGGHGGFPAGAEHMVLGHEMVGVVADPNDTALAAGDVVVPTVRRPPPGATATPYFDRGEPDMAPPGSYVERGIEGAHGFMADYVTSPEQFLVRVPDALRAHGFLLEPLSNVEKAVEHAFATRSAFEWDPESAFVLGNGPLGLLALARLRDAVERRYCLGRRDRPDPTIEVIEALGATYVDSRETPVADVADAHEAMDLVVEATGHAPHALDALDALAPNGVGALLGLPGPGEARVDLGRLHRETVLGNRALVGSVNSNVGHFAAAVETLGSLPDWVPEALVTDVSPPADVATAFARGDDVLKGVVEFAAP